MLEFTAPHKPPSEIFVGVGPGCLRVVAALSLPPLEVFLRTSRLRPLPAIAGRPGGNFVALTGLVRRPERAASVLRSAVTRV